MLEKLMYNYISLPKINACKYNKNCKLLVQYIKKNCKIPKPRYAHKICKMTTYRHLEKCRNLNEMK